MNFSFNKLFNTLLFLSAVIFFMRWFLNYLKERSEKRDGHRHLDALVEEMQRKMGSRNTTQPPPAQINKLNQLKLQAEEYKDQPEIFQSYQFLIDLEKEREWGDGKTLSTLTKECAQKTNLYIPAQYIKKVVTPLETDILPFPQLKDLILKKAFLNLLNSGLSLKETGLLAEWVKTYNQLTVNLSYHCRTTLNFSLLESAQITPITDIPCESFPELLEQIQTQLPVIFRLLPLDQKSLTQLKTTNLHQIAKQWHPDTFSHLNLTPALEKTVHQNYTLLTS